MGGCGPAQIALPCPAQAGARQRFTYALSLQQQALISWRCIRTALAAPITRGRRGPLVTSRFGLVGYGGIGSLEIRGHLDPDPSPREDTAARSFPPDLARIGPRFQQNPPNSSSSAPHGTSGSVNRIEDRNPPRPSDGPDLCGLQSSPRRGQAPKTKNKHKMRLLRCPLPSSR